MNLERNQKKIINTSPNSKKYFRSEIWSWKTALILVIIGLNIQLIASCRSTIARLGFDRPRLNPSEKNHYRGQAEKGKLLVLMLYDIDIAKYI